MDSEIKKSVKLKDAKFNFIELYFRFISFLMWPIYWYKWMVITIENYNKLLFTVYFFLDIVFIIVVVVVFLFKKNTSKYYFYFEISTSTTYLVSLLSFMIFPRNVYLLYLKILLCMVHVLISWKLIKKDENDIGVVGIMSGILLLVLTYFY